MAKGKDSLTLKILALGGNTNTKSAPARNSVPSRRTQIPRKSCRMVFQCDPARLNSWRCGVQHSSSPQLSARSSRTLAISQTFLLELPENAALFRGFADLRRLPRHNLPSSVTPQKSPRVSIMRCFHFSVRVLSAPYQPERHDHGVTIFVDRYIFR